VAGAVACCAGMLTGCSSGSSNAAGTCGTTHSAVGVPIVIKVVKGSVSCDTALSIENRYAAMIKAGDVRGTGGGAPVTVSVGSSQSWTCQGYPTPELLRTGDASQCHAGSAEILAVLPAPTAAATAG
jgi:hypothetical protein